MVELTLSESDVQINLMQDGLKAENHQRGTESDHSSNPMKSLASWDIVRNKLDPAKKHAPMCIDEIITTVKSTTPEQPLTPQDSSAAFSSLRQA